MAMLLTCGEAGDGVLPQEAREGCLQPWRGAAGQVRGSWRVQGGLGPESRGGCSLGGPARSPLGSEQLKGSCGWRELLGPERLTPHMAKVHRRLAIKGRTSLREKMTQGLLLCKQPQKKHRLLLRCLCFL